MGDGTQGTGPGRGSFLTQLLQWPTAIDRGSSPLGLPLDGPWGDGEEAKYLWYLNPRGRLPCTYEYTSTPSQLAIITVLCADLQRYLSRMCGGPPDINYTLHYSLHD